LALFKKILAMLLGSPKNFSQGYVYSYCHVYNDYHIYSGYHIYGTPG